MNRLLVAAAACLSFAFAAVPALAAPSPLEAYGRLPALSEVSLSPSGGRMAMIVDDGKERKLVVTALPGGPLAQIPLAGAKIRGIRWAGEDHLLVTSSQTHDFDLDVDYNLKTEIFQVLVVDLAHGKTFFVFHDGLVTNAVFGDDGVAQVDGHWYGFFEGMQLDHNHAPLSSAPDLLRVDLDTGAFTRAADGSESNRDWLVSASGVVLANSEYQSDVGQWRLYAGGDRGKLLVQTKDKLSHAGLVSQGQTPGSFIYVMTDADGDVTYLQTTGADPGGPLNGGHINGVLSDPVTGLAIGVTHSGDDRQVSLFDPLQQKRLDAVRKPFTGRKISLISHSADFKRVVMFTTGPGDSGTYWLIDGAKASQVGFEYPDVADGDVGPVRMVDYKAADGLDMRGVLTLPAGRDAKNLPLVVLPHGGPEAHDAAIFDWWAQAFAARGYAVFQPNFRGSSGRGRKFVEAGYGEWGRKMQTDVSDGVAELARQGIVDPKRACIVGGSYGGYAALAGVTVQQGLYRCAVSWGGVSDPGGMLRRSAEFGAANPETRYWKQFMGARDAISDSRINEVSPLALAGRADAPILLMHGKDDTVVPIAQSRAMAKALKSAGKAVEVVELPEDHWLSTSSARTAMLQASVAFVLKNNPPD